MDKFLEKYNLPKLNEEESPNRTITADEINVITKELLTHEQPGQNGFTGKFYKTFKEELTPIIHRLFKKSKEMEDS